MRNQPQPIERQVAMTALPPRSVSLTIVPNAPAAVPEASFGPLEWLVIATAVRRPQRSLRGSRLAPLLIAVHGPEALDPSAPMGALASMAAASARLGWGAPPCEMAAFLRAGWSDAQLELLIDTVESHA